jgi:hypothetical protein
MSVLYPSYVLCELPVKLDGLEAGTQVHWNNPWLALWSSYNPEVVLRFTDRYLELLAIIGCDRVVKDQELRA